MKTSPCRRAFTLLELLLVIAVIAILMVLIAPVLGTTVRAYNVTSATQTMISVLNRARQEAISRNRSVDFQLLKTSRDSSPVAYIAMRHVILDEFSSASGSNAVVNKTVWLPQGVVISEDSTRSDLATPPLQSTNVTLPGGSTATASYFTIRPNGMISTPTTVDTLKWTLTSAQGQTNNFSTIQLDTRTGIARLFRP